MKKKKEKRKGKELKNCHQRKKKKMKETNMKKVANLQLL